MKKIIPFLITLILLMSCKEATKKKSDKLSIVTTTTIITDLIKNLGEDAVDVKGIMGTGVDPHLYKASEGDISKLSDADLIIYNGLHLEGKLVEIFEKMNQTGKTTIALSDFLPEERLINSEFFATSYDPHIWFSIENWKIITEKMSDFLIKIDNKKADIYKRNKKNYLEKLKNLKKDIEKTLLDLPQEKRILVTAHDAFSYFSKEWNFQVIGIQGLSTVIETGVRDLQRASDFIIEKKVKSIFMENSVSKKTIKAIQETVKRKNYNVEIGGELFSDALGNPNEENGKYIGMYLHNVNIIVNGLK